RIAGLEGERGDIDRDVRARFVDRADDAEGDAHLRELQTVRQRVTPYRDADRVGERDDVPDRRAEPGESRVVEGEAIDEPRRQPVVAPVREIELVRGEDLGRAVLDRLCDCLETGVLRLRRGEAERPGRLAGECESIDERERGR